MYRQASEASSATAVLFGPAASPGPLSGPDLPGPLSGPDLAVLSLADPGIESRVALFVPGALELACALLRRGVAEATMVRPGGPHPVADADVAIIPQVPSAEFLCAAIRCARAMLVPLGTITIRLDQSGQELGPRSGPDGLSTLARHQLLLHGFTAIQVRTVCGVLLVRAELPLCGRLACA